MSLTEKEQKQFDVLIGKKKLTTQETVIFQRLNTKKNTKDNVEKPSVISTNIEQTKSIFNNGKKNDVRLIDINSIKPNPYQPRKHFRKNEIDGIKENIRSIGLLQPILICSFENDLYLGAGQKRLMSFIELNKEEVEANKEPFEMEYLKIQATVKEIDDLLDLAKLSIAENESRENPFIIDTANSLLSYYNELKKKEGNAKLSKNEFAEIVRKEFNIQSNSTLTKYLKIATLEQEIQDIVFEKEFNNMTFLYYLAKTHMSLEEKIKELKLNISNEKKSSDFVDEKKAKKEVIESNNDTSDFKENEKAINSTTKEHDSINSDFEEDKEISQKSENENSNNFSENIESNDFSSDDNIEKKETNVEIGQDIDVNIVTDLVLSKNIKGAIEYLEKFI
jgi:ParB family chromosome partitioning protein